MKKVAIMCRVSSDEQIKGYSLDDQYEKLTDYCRKHNYEIVYEFKEDHSAKSFNRPEWKKMLQLIKFGKLKIDEVLFTSWDRFSRNMVEGLTMIEKLREEFNIDPQAIQQFIDYSVPESKYLLAIYLASPNVDNDNRSKNIRKGIRQGLKQGRWPRQAFYGYKTARHDDGKSMLVIDDEKGKIVTEIFERVADGMAQSEIRSLLQKRGITVSRNNMSKILKRLIYTGKIIVPAHENEQMKIVEGIHEPLVSEALFFTVQQILTGKRKTRGKYISKYAKLRDDFHLRGVIDCNECGHSMTSSFSKGKLGKRYGYYHCHHCKKQRVSSIKVHKAFDKLIKGIQIEPEVRAIYDVILAEQMGCSEKGNKIEAKKLQKQLDLINERLERSQDLMLDGMLEPTEYVKIKSRYSVQENEIKLKISSLRASTREFSKLAKSGLNLLSNITETYYRASIRLKHKIVGSIFLENFSFDGKTFRTPKLNSIFDLFGSMDKGFRENKKGQPIVINQLSPTADSEGFEPPVP